MTRASIILADFAETDPGGKVHILGAGWSATGPGAGPQAVVGFIQTSAELAGAPIQFTLRLTDRSGEVVVVPGPAGMQRMEVSGQAEIREPDGWDGSTDLNAVFAVNVMVSLPQGQSYTWSLEVDGKDLASTSFYVRTHPPDHVPVQHDGRRD